MSDMAEMRQVLLDAWQTFAELAQADDLPRDRRLQAARAGDRLAQSLGAPIVDLGDFRAAAYGAVGVEPPVPR